jgi:hypothetical protein
VRDVTDRSRRRAWMLGDVSRGGPDPRCYRVNCDKLAQAIPASDPVERASRGRRATGLQYGLTRQRFSVFPTEPNPELPRPVSTAPCDGAPCGRVSMAFSHEMGM